MNGVFHHHQRHMRRGDAPHRANGTDVMARDEFNLTLFQQRQRLLLAFGPLLKQAGPNAGTANRATHFRPGDRRAGMQQFSPLCQLRDQVFS
ncbi:hypothetical protein D3C80_1890860 [compost metagenome]